MKPVNKRCKSTLKQLAKYKDLSAVKRSGVDMHLRRCESCQTAWQGLTQLEQSPVGKNAMSQERKAAVYDRLVPSIHEIARQYSAQPKNRSYGLVFAATLAAAAGIAVAMLLTFFQRPQGHNIASIAVSPPPPGDVVEIPLPPGSDLSGGKINKMQGIVYVDGKPFSGMDDGLSLSPGTTVAVAEDSIMNFRMGRYVNISLVDETSWSVNEISPGLISLSLERGKLAVDYDGSLGRKMEIHTPESVVRVKGTVFTVEVFGDGVTQVSVTRGEVVVIPKDAGHAPVDVVAGKLLQVPGNGRVVELGDHQRILAAEVASIANNPGTISGRLVRFDGDQEHVQVEVDDRVVGFTPLTVRLPAGPVSYRLTKPGMQTVEAQLTTEQVGEQVQFTLNPSENYVPRVANLGVKRKWKKARATLNTEEVKDEESKSFVVRAKAAMSAGDMPYAARLLEETARRVEGQQLTTALSLLAECYTAMGDYKKAADTFDRVASSAPGTAIAQNSKYEIGRLAMDYIGDYDRARAAFTSYVASPVVGQLQEDAYFSLCELYGREGVRNNALQCFNDFLGMFPDGHRSAYAHLWRGVLHQEVDQQWRLAERDLLNFIAAKPRHPRCEEARYRIALGRYNLGDYGGAMNMFREYQEEHPGGQYFIRVERLKNALLEKLRARDKR